MDTTEPAEAAEAKAAGDVPPPEDKADSDSEKWEVVEEDEIAKVTFSTVEINRE